MFNKYLYFIKIKYGIYEIKYGIYEIKYGIYEINT